MNIVSGSVPNMNIAGLSEIEVNPSLMIAAISALLIVMMVSTVKGLNK